MGVVTTTARTYLNGEQIDEVSDSGSSITVTFSEGGIPLDFFSGEPERPGLSGTFEFGGYALTETTHSVVAAGNRVTVSYEDSLIYDDIPEFGNITMKGYSASVYTLLADGSIQYTTTMEMGSDFYEGLGYLGLSFESTGTLRR